MGSTFSANAGQLRAGRWRKDTEKEREREREGWGHILPQLEVCTAAAVEPLDVGGVELERRIALPLGRFRVGNLKVANGGIEVTEQKLLMPGFLANLQDVEAQHGLLDVGDGAEGGLIARDGFGVALGLEVGVALLAMRGDVSEVGGAGGCDTEWKRKGVRRSPPHPRPSSSV